MGAAAHNTATKLYRIIGLGECTPRLANSWCDFGKEVAICLINADVSVFVC